MRVKSGIDIIVHSVLFLGARNPDMIGAANDREVSQGGVTLIAVNCLWGGYER